MTGSLRAYDKPHLTFSQQLERLESRGLVCEDRDRAVTVLRSVGYYRFSAYVYPFRQPLAPDASRDTTVHYRSDEITAGTTFEQVESVWKFDRDLRLAWFDALEAIEIGIRTQIAYVLGRRDPFGHLTRTSLDETSCSRVHVGVEAFDLWCRKFEEKRNGARREDYIKHNDEKYGGQLPIWIAVEFLDFGAVARLFGLMLPADQNEIARDLGLKGGKQLASALEQLNYIRNLCAHHARLWNRRLTIKSKRYPAAALPEVLQHTGDVDNDRIYGPLAMTAHLVQQLDSQTNWPSRLMTRVRKFPEIPGITPQMQMGFPDGWDSEPLWRSHERR